MYCLFLFWLFKSLTEYFNKEKLGDFNEQKLGIFNEQKLGILESNADVLNIWVNFWFTSIYQLSNRWLKHFNVKIASQAKQRQQAKEWHGSDWDVEMAPFLINVDNKGKYEMHARAWSYILDLNLHLEQRLNSLER